MKTLCKPVLSYHYREQWLWYAKFVEEKTKNRDHTSGLFTDPSSWPRFDTYLHPDKGYHRCIPCWQADLNLLTLPEPLIPEIRTEIPMRCYSCPLEIWRWRALTDNTCCERISEMNEAMGAIGFGSSYVSRNIVAKMEWNWKSSETIDFFSEVNKALIEGKNGYDAIYAANKKLRKDMWDKYIVIKNRYYDRYQLINHMFRYGAKLCQ